MFFTLISSMFVKLTNLSREAERIVTLFSQLGHKKQSERKLKSEGN